MLIERLAAAAASGGGVETVEAAAGADGESGEGSDGGCVASAPNREPPRWDGQDLPVAGAEPDHEPVPAGPSDPGERDPGLRPSPANHDRSLPEDRCPARDPQPGIHLLGDGDAGEHAVAAGDAP